jgi:hypothetical protein
MDWRSQRRSHDDGKSERAAASVTVRALKKSSVSSFFMTVSAETKATSEGRKEQIRTIFFSQGSSTLE